MIGFANLENSLSWGALPLATRIAATGGGPLATTRAMSETSIKQLFEGVSVKQIRGDVRQQVTCLITDSRRVVPGALFFAVGGLRTDGNLFMEEAIDRGAVAVVSENPAPRSCAVTYIQVEDVRIALAEVSQRFYRRPDSRLTLFGVTGTNGKTTVSMLTQHLLSNEDRLVGLIGTVRYDLGRRTLPSYKTTPESVDVYAMLDQMHAQGCQEAVLEVSSHGIDQKRVHGMKFPYLAFMNLTQDHLDYHKDLDSYFEVKSRLFTGACGNMPKGVVINANDPYGQKLIKMIPEGVQVVSYGLMGDYTLNAENIELGPDGSSFTLHWPEGDAVVKTRLLGAYNISNILASLGLCYVAGMDIRPLIKKVAAFGGVPGRMERVEAGQPYNVLVDYAHTEDALNNALTMLRSITPGRILVVFGCGGNRDRNKREKMTAVVQRMADLSWATSDNPRKESIESIFADMKKGVFDESKIHFVEDRRRAISLALDEAREGDCVLIAGKGHETYQEFADTVVPFDDRQVARELLELKSYRRS